MNSEKKIVTINNINYQITQLIGQGSCAQVYSATNQIDNTQCAIKMSKYPRNKNQLKYALTEIALHRSFNHKNIIKYYDDEIIQSKHIYLVMQKAQMTLRKYCKQRGENNTLSEKNSIAVLIDILKALGQLNYKNMIHRDLKTQNILFKEGSFKISDFGISVRIKDEARTVIGTPLYLAPQILQEKNYDSKVDIWCLAIILFEIYFGEVPFYCSNYSRFSPMKLEKLIQDICIPEFNFDKIIENYRKQNLSESKIGQILEKKIQASQQFVDLLQKMFVVEPKFRYNIFDIANHPILQMMCPGTSLIMQKQLEPLKFMLCHINFLEITIQELKEKNKFSEWYSQLIKKCIVSLQIAITYFKQMKYKPKSIYSFQLSQDIQKLINKPWGQLKQIIKAPLIDIYKEMKLIPESSKILLFRILVCIESHHIFLTPQSYINQFKAVLGDNMKLETLQTYLSFFSNQKEQNKKLILMINSILEKYFSKGK